MNKQKQEAVKRLANEVSKVKRKHVDIPSAIRAILKNYPEYNTQDYFKAIASELGGRKKKRSIVFLIKKSERKNMGFVKKKVSPQKSMFPEHEIMEKMTN